MEQCAICGQRLAVCLLGKRKKNSSRVCHFLSEGHKRGYCKLSEWNMNTKNGIGSSKPNRKKTLSIPHQNPQLLTQEIIISSRHFNHYNTVNTNHQVFSQPCQFKSTQKQTDPICIARVPCQRVGHTRVIWTMWSELNTVWPVSLLARGCEWRACWRAFCRSCLSVRRRTGTGFCRRWLGARPSSLARSLEREPHTFKLFQPPVT